MSDKIYIKRKTTETDIKVIFTMDGTGQSKISTAIPFFNHMLIQISKHGFFDLEIEAKGDIDVDYHHTVEDVGIVFGEVVKKSLGDKTGLRRYGFASIPMDETLVNLTIDICGRPYLGLKFHDTIHSSGPFDVELAKEFLRAFCLNSGITLHVDVISGTNLHHIIEAIFKGLGKALDDATKKDERMSGIPSTKGML